MNKKTLAHRWKFALLAAAAAIITIIVVVVVKRSSASTAVIPSSDAVATTSGDTKLGETVSNTSDNVVLHLYDQFFVDGLASVPQGSPVMVYEKVNTALQCGNYLEDNKATSAIAANWDSVKKTCTLVSAIQPIAMQATNTLVTKNVASDVNSWNASETSTLLGPIFCSDVLANSTYAASLCSSIPECGGYTLEYNASNSNRPTGCLLAASGVTGRRDNTTSKAGRSTRATASPPLPQGVSARWESSIPFSSSDQSTVITSTTLPACALGVSRMTASYKNAYGVYSTDNRCTLFYSSLDQFGNLDSSKQISDQRSSTLLMANPNPKYANNWVKTANTDYPADLTSMPGNGTALDLKTATLACANSSACNAFVVDQSGKVYFSTAQTVSTNASTNTAYTPPPTFP
jgi:hypothetical protein